MSMDINIFVEKIKLVFTTGIAIVSPNDSGKSNVSDTIHWVLGEQSAGTLRGTKKESFVMRQFLLTLCALLFFAIPVYASDNIRIVLDREEVVFEGQGPVIVEGRTLVPVREVFELMGFTLAWGGDIRQVTLIRNSDVIVITIDSYKFTANGASHNLDVPAQIIGDRTLMPLRAILESVGYELTWDGAANTVLINSGEGQFQALRLLEINRPAYVTIQGRMYSTDITEFRWQITFLSPDERPPSEHYFALLSYMTNLTSLTLMDSGITDLTPLAGLTNLTELRLAFNPLSDLTPLSGLTSLTRLDLTANRISDLTPLAGLTNLTLLGVAFNHDIYDITPLAGLTNLTVLDMSQNLGVRDITPLSGLTNLEYLGLTSISLNDVTPLSGMVNLTYLNLSFNEISDLTPLSSLTNLTRLNLVRNRISDIAPLAGLTNLTELNLSTNRITDITPLYNLVKLTRLDLAANQITDITLLAGMENLEFVGLHGNPITDWSPVEHVEDVRGMP